VYSIQVYVIERWLPFDGCIISLMPRDEKRIDLSKSFKIFGLLFTQFYVPVRATDETAIMLTQTVKTSFFAAVFPFLLIFGGFV